MSGLAWYRRQGLKHDADRRAAMSIDSSLSTGAFGAPAGVLPL
jgi:hypothetical protein